MRIGAALRLGATLAFSMSAEAAPVVGPPFFLAHTEEPTTDYSVTASADALMLAWSSYGNTYAQRLGKDGRLTVGPWWLGGNSDGSWIPDPWTSGARVASNGADHLVWWERAFCGFGSPFAYASPPPYAVGAILSSADAPSSVSLGPEGACLQFSRFSEVAPAASGWAVMTQLWNMPSREETLSVDVLDPGGTSTARYFLPPGTPMALAASGESILAAWQDVDGLHVGFVGDATGPLTDSDVPPGTTRILLDWNGSAYLAVWEASGVAAARIKTDGVVDPIVLGSDGGMQVGAAITLLDVETAGGTSLVLYEEAHGDGGTLVRGMRIDAAGTVLDPGGFDVAPGSGGDVAAVQPGLWLVATAEDVEGTHLIRGRFVGDTTVPTPPDNVELPVVDPPGVPTDGEAGVADAARPDAPRDAGDPPDAATDGAAQPGADAYEVPLSAPVRGDMPQGCSCRLAHGRPEAPISWNAVAGLALAALCAARARARPSGKDSADS